MRWMSKRGGSHKNELEEEVFIKKVKVNQPKRHFSKTIRDTYEDYKKNQKDSERETIEYTPYKKYVYSFFQEVLYQIVAKGWHFVLPYQLGDMYYRETKRPRNNFGKKPVKSEAIALKNKELEKPVYQFTWSKEHVRFTNRAYYTFKLNNSRYDNGYTTALKFIADYKKKVDRTPGLELPKGNTYTLKHLMPVEIEE